MMRDPKEVTLSIQQDWSMTQYAPDTLHGKRRLA
jgi:hypothetical protein